jgi:predicted phosphodiesterase
MLEHPTRKIFDALSAVDLIIHAGDFTDVKLLEELKRLGEVKAV